MKVAANALTIKTSDILRRSSRFGLDFQRYRYGCAVCPMHVCQFDGEMVKFVCRWRKAELDFDGWRRRYFFYQPNMPRRSLALYGRARDGLWRLYWDWVEKGKRYSDDNLVYPLYQYIQYFPQRGCANEAIAYDYQNDMKYNGTPLIMELRATIKMRFKAAEIGSKYDRTETYPLVILL